MRRCNTRDHRIAHIERRATHVDKRLAKARITHDLDRQAQRAQHDERCERRAAANAGDAKGLTTITATSMTTNSGENTLMPTVRGDDRGEHCGVDARAAIFLGRLTCQSFAAKFAVAESTPRRMALRFDIHGQRADSCESRTCETQNRGMPSSRT